MIIQTKTLKTILKRHGITDKWGYLKVTTEKNKHGEYGSATCYTRALTALEIEAIKQDNQYIKIFNSRENDFSIITY